MASFHRCDQCGGLLRKPDDAVPVLIGCAPRAKAFRAMMVVVLGEQEPVATPLETSAFELCKECATALALALWHRKALVQKADGPPPRSV